MSDEEQPKEDKKTKAELKLERVKEIKAKQEELVSEAIDMKDIYDIQSELYLELDNYIEMVTTGISNGLIVEGDAGIGKTTRIMKKFADNESEEKYVAYQSGFTTPAQMYVWLYEHRGYKNKVLDDVDGLLDNTKCLAMLKASLWEIGGKRLVSYNTTKPLEDSEGMLVDLTYEEKGNIIILTNYINKTATKTRDHVKALLSRVNNCEIRPDLKQLIEIIRQISVLPYKDLTTEERKEVFDYLRDNVSDGAIDFNIRTLLKMFDFYLLAKFKSDLDLWKSLSKKLLETINVGRMITELHQRAELVDNDIYKLVFERTGISKATYYRIKQQLGLSVRKKVSMKFIKAEEKKQRQEEDEMEVAESYG